MDVSLVGQANALFSMKCAHNSLEMAHQYTVKENDVVAFAGMQFTKEANLAAYQRAVAYKEARLAGGQDGEPPWKIIVARATQSGINPSFHETAYAALCLEVFRECKPTTEQYQVTQSRYAKLQMLDKHSSGFSEMVESFARRLRFVLFVIYLL